MPGEPLLSVLGLTTTIVTRRGTFDAVRDVSFQVHSAEIVGLVGESGCGKTMTALSLMRLLSRTSRISKGQILFEGSDLLSLTEKQMQSVRGNKISIVFQEPMTSLNPVMNIGDQVSEGLVIHQGLTRGQAHAEAIRLLHLAKFPDPEKRIHEYPHQLSGGMLQRVMIAMAISCRPALLIADEPTTALDVTIQAEILDLLVSLRNELGLSILLITHALGVIAEIADRVLVMYAGKIVEEAPVRKIFASPGHPYTVALMNAVPRIDRNGETAERLKTIDGTVADLMNLPKGCSFYDRCCDRMPHCTMEYPPAFSVSHDHTVACYKYGASGS